MIRGIELAVAVYIVGYVLIGRYAFRQLGPFKAAEVQNVARKIAALTLFWPPLAVLLWLYLMGFGLMHLLAKVITNNNTKH